MPLRRGRGSDLNDSARAIPARAKQGVLTRINEQASGTCQSGGWAGSGGWKGVEIAKTELPLQEANVLCCGVSARPLLLLLLLLARLVLLVLLSLCRCWCCCWCWCWCWC